MGLFKSQSWSALVLVGRPFFVSSMRWRALAALAGIVALLVLLNGLNVVNSYVGRSFITAIAERDRARYALFTGLYIAVFAASTVVGVSQQFVQDRLALSWRDWLTRHLIVRYLSGRTFERLEGADEIDNPDQRISQDVRTFTSTLLSFVVMVTNAALTTIAFAGVLWSITPLLLLTSVLYAVVGSLLTIRLGYSLVGLNYMQLKKEADMRYALMRARDHVALAEVAPPELRRVRAHLRRVVHNTKAIIGVTRNVSFFTSGYNYLVQIIPILVVAPLYLDGRIELGVVTQSAMAFAQLLGAFSLIVVQFQSITAFAAVGQRLGTLWEEMHRGEEVSGRPSKAAQFRHT